MYFVNYYTNCIWYFGLTVCLVVNNILLSRELSNLAFEL